MVTLTAATSKTAKILFQNGVKFLVVSLITSRVPVCVPVCLSVPYFTPLTCCLLRQALTSTNHASRRYLFRLLRDCNIDIDVKTNSKRGKGGRSLQGTAAHPWLIATQSRKPKPDSKYGWLSTTARGGWRALLLRQATTTLTLTARKKTQTANRTVRPTRALDTSRVRASPHRTAPHHKRQSRLSYSTAVRKPTRGGRDQRPETKT